MKHFAIPFEEIMVKLDLPSTAAEIRKYSPSGKVPALITEDLLIWDSLAIMEYLNDLYPEKKMYPQDLNVRAQARSVASEMHSGFTNLRTDLSFHAKKKFTDFDLRNAQVDIDRIKEIWTACLAQSNGPFLFGNFSIADAMYAPVVGRFQTYSVPVDGVCKKYCDEILNLPAMISWYEGANTEDFIAAKHEKPN